MKVRELEIGCELYAFNNEKQEMYLIELIDLEIIDEETVDLTFKVSESDKLIYDEFDLEGEINKYKTDDYTYYLTKTDCFKDKIKEYQSLIDKYRSIIASMEKYLNK